ncbi:DMT family transporter [Nocardia terpenica]|uniref:EamA family transporter n=1 Tax=Nocardia terpenica TaxID=455432 RepID=A0A291RRS6_9NOCA|nr:DMT family transporter [Nocardia terpenica]ATL70321.1 EamA family transporter [Nocardia terpenica]
MNAVRIGLLALCWGSTFLWIKIALRALSPVQVTFFRMLIGAAFLALMVFAFQRRRLPRDPAVWGHLLVSAALANAIPYLLYTIAEEGIRTSSAGVISSTTPMWTLLTVAVWGRRAEGRAPRQVSGLLIGFLGCVLIFSPWRSGSDLMSRGGLECLVASVFLGVSYVYMEKFLARRDISPMMLSAGQLAAAGLLLTPALMVEGAPAPHPRLDALLALAVLGLLGTGVAYVLNYRVISDGGSVAASVVTYLLPVVSVVLGATVLDEPLTPMTLAGTALVLLGVALPSTRKRVKRDGPRTPAAPAVR